MSETKPFASLGPTLLARKGGARPAMRPQFGSLGMLGTKASAALNLAEEDQQALDDLGWNDMGYEEHTRHEADVLPLTPAPANPETEAQARADDAVARAELASLPTVAEAEPEVRRQQREVAEFVSAAPAPAAALRSAPRQRRRALEEGRRAAFTLRLDAQRHLKLRLASTVHNRSAQQIVTAALDQFLESLPELDTLAAQVKRERKGK
ncbi:conserved hypothetical protein [Altererythrobacter sp. B11]|uniref:hypothetical protein n=1 Tax=Altererythrobacter sp. B11 TaxID=2060312 RepID=UPI000DC708B2|nr:hypothetical protein [Altererythrobacter sp. B11]BBC74239.1 conserved hypothetical protein [Altererythrobacter sp. B11]